MLGQAATSWPSHGVCLVQILLAQHSSSARVEQHDVGIRADCQRPFPRIKAHDARCVRGDEPDKIGKTVAAFLDHMGVHQREPRLDAGIAAGGIVDAPALELDLERATHLVGGDRLDRAVPGRRPQRLLVLGEFQRGLSVVHLPTRPLVVLGAIEQVLVEGLSVDREALGP